MKKTLAYRTRGTCSRQIDVTVDENGVVEDVRIIGGCQGNTSGIELLAVGRPANELIELLSGINCGGRGTSCPDQLARALKECLAQEA